MMNTKTVCNDVCDSRQLRRKAELALAAEVKNLLGRDEAEGLCWKGTQVDLMEALYTVFTTGCITDDEGYGVGFGHLVDDVCRLLHTRRPRNPYCIARRGQVRKGIYRRTYMEEYERKFYKLGVPAPFSIAIGRGADGGGE